MKKSIKLTFFFVLFLFIGLKFSFATQGSEVVCVASMPCDEEGNLLEQYSKGECLDVYQDRCLNLRLEKITENELICQTKITQKNKKIRRLKRRIKYLESIK